MSTTTPTCAASAWPMTTPMRRRPRCITRVTPSSGGGRFRRAASALDALATAGVPLGVVSNASGQIEDVLSRSGVCQVGDGPHVSMRVIVDSHVVGVSKPDPRIFDFALGHFDRRRAARDRLRRRLGDDGRRCGARGAGLHPILLDPYDDHPDADFDRLRSLSELTARQLVG